MPPIPSIQKRHQHHTAHSPYEWKERREFSHNWKAKFHGNAQVITTDLAWTSLITPSNPRVTTTLEEGLELSKHLTLLQGICHTDIRCTQFAIKLKSKLRNLLLKPTSHHTYLGLSHQQQKQYYSTIAANSSTTSVYATYITAYHLNTH
ncbi:hypothetical protein VC83_05419 [Pseudogymnoascus destructans]|uniref:Uncharacterized protein n=1 Tax=Pseudogymnoascus destructans TaxID=655981 RepID=A0A177A7N3_9PEZI|nr:uncharacterized protein VC83_05419 [Pseudogymnoascus destructans]OAF58136.1 hypothetical protein VC83_05419 [Pseudogymnoascus destructans]